MDVCYGGISIQGEELLIIRCQDARLIPATCLRNHIDTIYAGSHLIFLLDGSCLPLPQDGIHFPLDDFRVAAENPGHYLYALEKKRFRRDDRYEG